MDVTAGWYPDPEDATNLRWWDGSSWTDHRQPIAQPAADPTATVDAATVDTNSVDAEIVDDMSDVTVKHPLVADLARADAPTEPDTPADEAPTADQAPTVETPAAAAEVEATETEASVSETAASETPAMDTPEHDTVDPEATAVVTPMVEAPEAQIPEGESPETVRPWASSEPTLVEAVDPTTAMAIPPPPPTGQADVPATPPPPPSGRGGNKRKPLLIGLGVVAVLAIAAGAFFFLTGDDSSEYTWDGENLTGLEESLEEADATFLAGVDGRNGAVTDDSRCYLVQSASEDAERSSDLLDFLRCGPVLFVDNDPGDGVWITYAIDAEENEDGDLTLTSAEAPQNAQPGRFDPDEESLSRPDGETPPDGDGGLDAPEPPRAEAGLVLSGEPVLDDLELESAFVREVGLTKSVDLVGVAEPSRFGSGDTARRPADGEKFVAFEIRLGNGDTLYGTPVDQDEASSTSSARISIDVDGELTTIAEGSDEDYASRHLVSVPEDAEAVDVVLDDSEVTQRISLLTQEPGPNNIDVLARTTRDVDMGQSQSFPVTITHADGSTQTDTFTVTLERAELLYYLDEVPDRVPSSPDKAFLVMYHHVTSDATGITAEEEIGLEPGHMHLDIGDGTVVEAINLAPNDDQILLAFEVPADFDEGTLAVRGAAPSGDLTIDLADPNFRTTFTIENV